MQLKSLSWISSELDVKYGIMEDVDKDDLIELGFRQAKAITRKYAQTFYFASRFLPKDKRAAAYSVYSVCRISDEAVDDTKSAMAEKLDQVKEKIAAVYEGGKINKAVLLAFRETTDTYQIPRQYFDQLISGMDMDLHQHRYQNFDQLYSYCYKVAGVVGLIMLKIFGYHSPQVESHAVDLGIAMQLTNILRDIKEDFARGRIYIPQDELAKFAVCENDIAQETVNNNFISLLKFQINRARVYYNSAAKGIRMINDIRSRFVVLAMKDIYSGILSAIEKNRFDVFSQRAHVNTAQKITMALQITLRGKYL